MNVSIGTCGNCGGRVSVPDIWHGTVPPTPTCETCGARPRQAHGPVIEMQPRSLDVVAVDHCKATTETFKP